MSDIKKYWNTFGARTHSPAHQERTMKKEFAHRKPQLPKEEYLGQPTSRRDFLKYLGFSTIGATLVASCENKVYKSIPYLNPPENIVPGQAYYYATTFASEGIVAPIMVKVREGRPIKIAANAVGKRGAKAATVRAQASLLNLYDVARLKNPLVRNIKENIQGDTPLFNNISESNLPTIDQNIITALKNHKGKIAILTHSLVSPVSKQIVAQFTQYYDAQLYTYDAISYEGILQANLHSFNIRAIPTYHLDKVAVILSIGADFLGTWLSPGEQSEKWAQTRKIKEGNRLSKHYQIEGLMSITGANADERYVTRPSTYAAVVQALYELLKDGNTQVSLPEKLVQVLPKIATRLKKAQGKALVLCDSNNIQIQILINAINELLSAYDTIIDWSHPVRTRSGKEEDIQRLYKALQEGKYEALITLGQVNPVYELPYGEDFAKVMVRLPLFISTATHIDETAQYAHYIFPDHHYLESWGDAERSEGTYAFLQPTIHPLFKTRNWQTSLLNWMEESSTLQEQVQQFWVKKLGSQEKYNAVLQEGVYEENIAIHRVSLSATAVATAYYHLKETTSALNTPWELVFYEKVAIGSGQLANNPWLQELPDPISKATWDNYAVISPAAAEKLGIIVDDQYEVHPEKPILELRLAGNKGILSLPVLVIPGVHPQVVGVALGYGRSGGVGRAAAGVGKKVTHYMDYEGGRCYFTGVEEVLKTSEVYPIAYTQTHNSYEGREEVLREFTLAEWEQNPQQLIEKRTELYEAYGNGVTDEASFKKEASLYPEKKSSGIRWGMSIDLNACFGCGACVVSCTAENNVSVVGKKRVLRSQEMHWLRIDRYFSGDMDNPEVIFQPMMCQHCDNAPCENVCPVGATMHSEEGVNHMAYNRCVGTRYCANNCPYKVRRFNWLDWNGSDSFPDNQRPLVEEGSLDEVVLDMNDMLTRMVLNPDVVTRSRGVIEKCSLCVQRLQEGKTKAQREGRPVKDGDVITACAEACSTGAIVFGNVNDPNSEVARLRNKDQKNRVFYVLEQLHTLPNVNYLAKIRNKD